MSKTPRIPTDGGQEAWTSPFAALKQAAGTVSPKTATRAAHTPPDTNGASTDRRPAAPRTRGRVDVRRETAHRGGKTVTVIAGFVGIGGDELDRLAKTLRQSCGSGGTAKDGRIEIQGDHRETVMRHLREAGFLPVAAGG
ncbi:MAG: translation initiation factor [Nitrospiraceae bacterium]